MSEHAGQIIAGRYRILSTIEQRTSSTRYLAEDIATSSRVELYLFPQPDALSRDKLNERLLTILNISSFDLSQVLASGFDTLNRNFYCYVVTPYVSPAAPQQPYGYGGAPGAVQGGVSGNTGAFMPLPSPPPPPIQNQKRSEREEQERFNERNRQFEELLRDEDSPPQPIRSTYPESTLSPSPPGIVRSTYGDDKQEKNTGETTLSLIAIARINLETGSVAFSGSIYTLEAGISQRDVEGFTGGRFNLTVQNPKAKIPFDIILHPGEHVTLVDRTRHLPSYDVERKLWHGQLLYDPTNPEPQLTMFQFVAHKPGKSELFINFYRERQWLKTIHIQFDVVEWETAVQHTRRG